jgi:hypothetical protein
VTPVLAEAWIRSLVRPSGPIETLRVRPWSTVLRVPVDGGLAWFKACAAVQAFEPRLSAGLAARWPDRVAEVLGYDEERAWLLLADAGTAFRESGNSPEAWLRVLPRYAELQRGEARFVADHLAHGVPDLRVALLPARYPDLLRPDLPVEPEGRERLRRFTSRFTLLCEELAAYGVPESIQHDDLHMANVYADRGRLRVVDWGDSSISHPFASLVVTFRFLVDVDGMRPDDPWFARLRDAYLEPWDRSLAAAFPLALRIGTFAHAIAWIRQRDALPEPDRPEFDEAFRVVLARAVGRTVE